jgi:hypothetical protein
MYRVTIMAAFVPAVFLVTAMQFIPPDNIRRAAAIGPTESRPEELRRAFDPRSDFQPLAAPGAADWLFNHAETGQPFEQFVASRPNRPDSRRKILYLQPIGMFGTGERLE